MCEYCAAAFRHLDLEAAYAIARFYHPEKIAIVPVIATRASAAPDPNDPDKDPEGDTSP